MCWLLFVGAPSQVNEETDPERKSLPKPSRNMASGRLQLDPNIPYIRSTCGGLYTPIEFSELYHHKDRDAVH